MKSEKVVLQLEAGVLHPCAAELPSCSADMPTYRGKESGVNRRHDRDWQAWPLKLAA